MSAIAMNADTASNGIRLHATDLREASRKSEALRAGSSDQVEPPPIVLGIEVLIARDSASAMRAYRDLPQRPGRPEPLRYIGTPRGLIGLIADLQRLGIADGVALVPLGDSPVAELMLDELAPGLGAAI